MTSNIESNASSAGDATIPRRNKLVSTWRLVSHQQQAVETGEVTYPRGEHPRGLLTYTDDGRFHVLNVPGERAKPQGAAPNDAEALALFRGLTAYAGSFSVDGDIVTHHVEISWNEAWSGTDQRRRFRLDGDTLTLTAGPAASPWDGKRVIATLTWKRLRST
jgi:hypothetical protein